jgi:hypothetical protein
MQNGSAITSRGAVACYKKKQELSLTPTGLDYYYYYYYYY